MGGKSGIRRAIMKVVRHQVRRIIRPIINREPNFPAKYIAYREEESDYTIAKPSRNATGDLPVPPQKLWVAVGPGGYGRTDEDYLSLGQKQVATIHDLLARVGGRLPAEGRVLDFGCASGRLIRWFSDQARSGEVWGVDISAEHIVWCQQNLSPPFHFCTTTTAPHLPFEDRYFDLIYAGSVFTHIDELADAWFLELRRLLRPGGFVFVTVNDKHSLEIIRQNPDFNLAKRLAEAAPRLRLDEIDFHSVTINRSYTIYDRDSLVAKLSRWFDVMAVEPEAYGFQTGILLKRV